MSILAPFSDADPALLSATRLHPQALARQARRWQALGETPWLHAQLAERMAERLDWIKLAVHRIVQWQPLWGGGDAALRRRYPEAQHSWVEAHADAARRVRPAWWQPWRAPLATVVAPQALPEGQAQLLWANLGLHGAANLRAALATWHRALAVDGFVLFSCWGPDSLLELRRAYNAEGWGPVTPAWVDLHDIGDLLVEAGFAEPVMDQERLTLTWPDADALWRDLAALGGNVHADRHKGLRTPRWRQRWRDAMAAHLTGADGRLALTLEFVVGHAIKPAPRVAVAPETRVGLDRLRDELRRPRG
jgi:malonyl-CoA O-methyltransferase